MNAPAPSAPAVRRSLDLFGGASRCLLRLRENLGLPVLSDSEFLVRFASVCPQWERRPGEIEADGLCLLARELGLARSVSITRDYTAVLRAHRFGRDQIIVTERPPLQQEFDDAPDRHALVLEQIDEDGFQMWCPFPSGASDVLPRAGRDWWNRWLCVAYILEPIGSSADSPHPLP